MLDLFKAIGLGLVVLLPLANPLTTVALFLGLAGNMNSAERNRQSLMASVYVFAIMMVAYYAGQLVMDTFGISIPGLRIAGGLIVAFIGKHLFNGWIRLTASVLRWWTVSLPVIRAMKWLNWKKSWVITMVFSTPLNTFTCL